MRRRAVFRLGIVVTTTAFGGCRSFSPTPTPAPTRAAARAPSSGELTAHSAVTEFLSALFTGREAMARSYLSPNYSATIADLRQATGIPPAQEYRYSIDEGEQAGGQIAVQASFQYPSRTFLARFHLEEIAGQWKITSIEPAN